MRTAVGILLLFLSVPVLEPAAVASRQGVPSLPPGRAAAPGAPVPESRRRGPAGRAFLRRPRKGLDRGIPTDYV